LALAFVVAGRLMNEVLDHFVTRNLLEIVMDEQVTISGVVHKTKRSSRKLFLAMPRLLPD
jgi:hypothetical protein